MSLAQALAATPKPKPGPKCAVHRILQTMTPEDADTLRAALTDTATFGHLRLFRALRALHFDLGRDAISRHRAGECACGPR